MSCLCVVCMRTCVYVLIEMGNGCVVLCSLELRSLKVLDDDDDDEDEKCKNMSTEWAREKN